MKLFIDENGDVHGVYSDTLATLNLGEMEIQRASNVEFSNGWQEWQAKLAGTNELIAYGANREEVIQKEIAIIEDRMEKKFCI